MRRRMTAVCTAVLALPLVGACSTDESTDGNSTAVQGTTSSSGSDGSQATGSAVTNTGTTANSGASTSSTSVGGEGGSSGSGAATQPSGAGAGGAGGSGAGGGGGLGAGGSGSGGSGAGGSGGGGGGASSETDGQMDVGGGEPDDAVTGDGPGSTDDSSVSDAGAGGSEAMGNPDDGDIDAGGSSGDPDVPSRPARVLLYSFSTLDIPSVPAQLTILRQQLESWDYEVDESEDPAAFTDERLAEYAAVGMINTCFSPFGANSSGESEGQVLQRFLQEGGGLFGTHCADVTFQSANPPALYNQLLGGRASSQNFDGTSQCHKVADHPTTAGLPETFDYVGNLDGTDFIADDSEVLVRCNWGDANNTEVAVSWVRNEGVGRVFFTNFAKVDGDLSDPTVGQEHIMPGLAWVLGR